MEEGIMASCAAATPVSSSTSTSATLTVTDNAKKLARKDKESLCELDSQVKGSFNQFSFISTNSVVFSCYHCQRSIVAVWSCQFWQLSKPNLQSKVHC